MNLINSSYSETMNLTAPLFLAMKYSVNLNYSKYSKCIKYAGIKKIQWSFYKDQ